MGVDSGLVSLARPLDHEDQYHYSLTVMATDGVHSNSTKVSISQEQYVLRISFAYKRNLYVSMQTLQ